MSRSRGDAVVATDPFGYTGRRPYLLVSDDDHPFHGEEYLAAAVTTAREPAVPLGGAYEAGELPRESFASPWAVLTLKERDVEKRVATVSADVVESVTARIVEYVTAD